MKRTNEHLNENEPAQKEVSTKARRTTYEHDFSSRRLVSEEPKITFSDLIHNPTHTFQNKLYELSQVASQRTRHSDEFYQDVDDIIYSLKSIIRDHFNNWSSIRRELDRSLSIVNKTTSFIIYNFSQIAKYSQELLSAEALNFLLQHLTQEKLTDPLIILRSTNGLSMLARLEKINGAIETSLLEQLLTQLMEMPQVSEKDLYNCLKNISLIANSKCLSAPIKTELVQQLLVKIYSKTPLSEESIGNIMYQLGKMAQPKMLSTPINIALLQPLFEQANNLTTINAKLAKGLFYGMMLLLESTQVDGIINAQLLQNLFNKQAPFSDETFEQIAKKAYVLNLLARGEHLQGTIDFNVLLRAIKIPNPASNHDLRTVVQMIYAPAVLAQQGNLKEPIDAQALQAILAKLPEMACSEGNRISELFKSLGILVQTKNLDAQQLNGLNTVLAALLQKLFTLSLNAIDAEKVLSGLVELGSPLNCRPEQINRLFQAAILQKSYLHPHDVVNYLAWLTRLSQIYSFQQLNDSFNYLLLGVNFPLYYLNNEKREQILQNLMLLEQIPTCPWANRLRTQWRIPLSQNAESSNRIQRAPSTAITSGENATQVTPSQPQQNTADRIEQHPENWDSAYHDNALFQAIADKNLYQLARLLGINIKSTVFTRTTHTPAIRATPSSTRHTASHNDSENADNQVAELLQNTNANTLRALVMESTASYFELLLRACSRHMRYQLAISRTLHPILLYLPINELDEHVVDLISLEFYRDSKALFSLVDALKLRALAHAEEQETILDLQIKLLDRANAFHQDTNHHNVVAYIQTTKTLLLRQQAEQTKQTQPTPPQTSIQNTVQQSTVQQPDSMLVRQSIFTPPRQQLVVNNRYFYQTDDLNRILKLRLHTSATPGLIILTAANMNENTQGNRVINVLSQYLTGNYGRMAVNALEQNIIIPIVYNNHWVGIRIQLKHGETPKITYYNSVKGNTYDDDLMVNILMEVNKALVQHSIWKNPSIRLHDKCMAQNDGSSCGAFLIENIYCDLENATWQIQGSQSLADAFRRRHLRLLNDLDRPFYQVFYNRQAGLDEPANKTVNVQAVV